MLLHAGANGDGHINYKGELTDIMLTRHCYLYPLKPLLFMPKLEFTGVYIILLISALNQRLCIMLTNPLRPLYTLVKMGFTGVYIIYVCSKS